MDAGVPNIWVKLMFGVDLYLEYKRARENAPHEGEGHSSNNHHPSQVSIVYGIEK
jgi:hypothetical protein